jgi:hypothetical protein
LNLKKTKIKVKVKNKNKNTHVKEWVSSCLGLMRRKEKIKNIIIKIGKEEKKEK